VGFAVDKNLVSIVSAWPRGNAVPHVREAALIEVAAQTRFHFKGTDELAHGTDIGEYRACCGHFSFFQQLDISNPILVEPLPIF